MFPLNTSQERTKCLNIVFNANMHCFLVILGHILVNQYREYTCSLCIASHFLINSIVMLKRHRKSEKLLTDFLIWRKGLSFLTLLRKMKLLYYQEKSTYSGVYWGVNRLRPEPVWSPKPTYLPGK